MSVRLESATAWSATSAGFFGRCSSTSALFTFQVPSVAAFFSVDGMTFRWMLAGRSKSKRFLRASRGFFCSAASNSGSFHAEHGGPGLGE